MLRSLGVCSVLLYALAQAGMAATPAAPATAAVAATATAPATAPAAALEDPRAALTAFAQAMYEGDAKGTFARLYLPNDDAKREADSAIGREVYRMQLDKVMAVEFKTEAPTSGMRNLEEISRQIQAATVTINDDKAEIALQERSVIYMVRDKEEWKVDFSRTQRKNSGEFNAERVAQDAARVQVVKGIIADVEAHKFKTRQDADAEMQKRMAAVQNVPVAVAGDPNGPAQANSAQALMAKIAAGLKAFEVDNGRYPTTAEGLAALVQKPENLPNATGKYLTEVPRDPWGRPFVYMFPSPDNPAEFGLISSGPDGIFGNADDITRK